MQDPDPALPTEQASRISVWTWLKHPWLLLIFGGVISLGLWMGIGLWIEHQRALALEELKRDSSIEFHFGWYRARRFPIWLPEWLGRQFPNGWNLEIEYESQVVFSLRPTDQQLSLLNRLPGIEVIDISDASLISDNTLLDLIATHPLIGLKFRQSRRLTAQHLAALANQKGLKSLDGLRGPFDQATLDLIAKFTGLSSLSLDGPLQGSTDLASISVLPKLNCFEWDHSELRGDQFAHLASRSTLTYLRLQKTQLSSKSWPLLETMRLETLELESPHLDDNTVLSLVHLESLRRLQLRGGKITDCGVEELLVLPKLSDLEVDSRGLTVAGVRAIRPLHWLSRIAIYGGPKVTNEWLAEFAGKELDGLAFLNSAVTDDGVTLLKGHQSLSRLALPGSGITDRCMAIFNTLPHLDALDLRNTAITDAGLRAFSFANQNRDEPKDLHLGCTHVTRRGVEEFLARYPEVSVQGVEGIQPLYTSDWVRPLDEDESN